MHEPQPYLPHVFEFAAKAHGKQVRKYTGDPYIYHPVTVALTIAEILPERHDMQAAALLHDVVEDTPVTLPQIEREFGGQVANLVFWLTDKSVPSDGNRAHRKQIDREHIAAAPPDAKTIKLADLIDNSRSITEHDPGFARVFMAEKRLLLPALREGDSGLWHRAEGIVHHWEVTHASA